MRANRYASRRGSKPVNTRQESLMTVERPFEAVEIENQRSLVPRRSPVVAFVVWLEWFDGHQAFLSLIEAGNGDDKTIKHLDWWTQKQGQ